MSLEGKKILVIGANGFVGSRLCERLVLEQRADVVGLVRNLGRSARIGRLGMRIVRGDVLDSDLMRGLLKDTEVVVNLLAKGRASIIDGSRLAARLSREAGVERFIHMSTAAVYGIEAGPGHVVETAPLVHTGTPYADAKIAAEQHVNHEMAKGLRAVSLRPRIIWGPYSAWVTGFYSQAAKGGFGLVDNGRGACNTIYIDNLVDAVFWGIENDAAVGEVFFVTDDEQLTWRQYYERWNSFLPRPVEFSSVDGRSAATAAGGPSFPVRLKQFLVGENLRACLAEAPGTSHLMKMIMPRLAELPEPRKLAVKKTLSMGWPERDIGPVVEHGPPVDQGRILRERGTGYTDISKLKSYGFRPRVDFETGTTITLKWLKAARII